jgi:two-component system, chemotaxis family, response regulator Rcp1
MDILLVEDNPGDVRLVQEVFRGSDKPVRLYVVGDGVEAIAYLKNEGIHVLAPRPDFILLDINMPKMDGLELLAQIKRDYSLRMIPTVILTTSEADADIMQSYQFLANCYLKKPVELHVFEELVKGIDDFRLRRGSLPQLVFA